MIINVYSIGVIVEFNMFSSMVGIEDDFVS